MGNAILNKGDTIGIIALSGNIERDQADLAKNNIEALGYKVKLSNNIYSKDRYLAGSDEEKINAFYEMLLDKDIKLIMAARGGYGTIRLVNKLDYNLIKSNPKLICGFSDMTAILLMIYKRCGFVTYHSPMAAVDFASDVNDFTKNNFFETINGESHIYEGVKIYRDGCVNGILWGGNLATVVSLCGLDFIPDEDFIFFTEDLNEPIYKIDRMFHQLMNINKFRKNCKGIVLGEFLDVDNQEWLGELFDEISRELRVPTVDGYKITHGKEKITLPIGKQANLTGKLLKV